MVITIIMLINNLPSVSKKTYLFILSNIVVYLIFIIFSIFQYLLTRCSKPNTRVLYYIIIYCKNMLI